MKQIKYNGHRLELYDSIMNLPEERFALFNRMILIDSEVGADLDAVDNHLIKAVKFIQAEQSEKAITILNNMRESVNLILTETSPESKAFACLVKRINGKIFNGNSEQDIEKLQKLIKTKVKTPIGLMRVTIEAAKKKFKRSWTSFFQR